MGTAHAVALVGTAPHAVTLTGTARVTVAWTAAEWDDAFRRGGEKQKGPRARNR